MYKIYHSCEVLRTIFDRQTGVLTLAAVYGYTEQSNNQELYIWCTRGGTELAAPGFACVV